MALALTLSRALSRTATNSSHHGWVHNGATPSCYLYPGVFCAREHRAWEAALVRARLRYEHAQQKGALATGGMHWSKDVALYVHVEAGWG